MNKSQYDSWWSGLSDEDKTAYSTGNKMYPKNVMNYLIRQAKTAAAAQNMSLTDWLKNTTQGQRITNNMTGPYGGQVILSFSQGKYAAGAPRVSTGTGTPTPTGTPAGSSTEWSSFLTAGTYKYPSAEYLKSHNVTDQALIDAYAGKVIPNATTAATALAAIHQHFGTENTRKIFKDYKNFDPIVASVGTGRQKTAEMGKMGQIWDSWKTSGGLESVKPELFDQWGTSKSNAQLMYEGQVLLANAQATAAKKSGVYQSMDSQLQAMGLGSLAPMVRDLVFNKNVTDANEIMKAIRNDKRGLYDSIFNPNGKGPNKWGLAQYNADPTNTVKLSEMDYLGIANAMRETARTFGLDEKFFDNKEIGNLIGQGVSRAELNRRLLNGYMVAKNAFDTNSSVATYLTQQGITAKDLLKYYLDPTKGEAALTQQATKAQLQGYAQDVGVRDFTSTMADEMAKLARTNINTDGTFSTGAELAALQEAGAASMLTGATPGSGAPTVSTEQLIGSRLPGFGTTDTLGAQQAIETASEAQTAPFRKGGGFVASQEGVTGLGQV
jgi:hypothetical protein